MFDSLCQHNSLELPKFVACGWLKLSKVYPTTVAPSCPALEGFRVINKQSLVKISQPHPIRQSKYISCS